MQLGVKKLIEMWLVECKGSHFRFEPIISSSRHSVDECDEVFCMFCNCSLTCNWLLFALGSDN